MKKPKNKANTVSDLEITKVDFVDAGANQRANIALFKHKPQGTAEGGEIMENKTGNPVKKFIAILAKRLGVTEDETAAGIQAIAKGDNEAQTYNQTVAQMQRRKIYCQIWDVTDALGQSLRSIFGDDEADDKAALMKQSVDEFAAACKGYIDAWTAGEPAPVFKQAVKPTELEKSIAVERAQDVLKTACKTGPEVKPKPEKKAADVEPDDPNPDGTPKSVPKKVDGSAGAGSTAPQPKNKPIKKSEEEPEMKINKSKLTPEELAFYDAIVKKAGEPEENQPDVDNGTGDIGKAKEKAPSDKLADTLKALPVEVRDLLTDLQKRADAAEDREMTEVAKKYEILGKKPEELAPVLKNLKKNSPEGYEATINALDQAVEATKASGMFGEIGKRGVTGQNGNAWAQIEKKAADIRKSNPAMEYHESIDVACQQNPDLVHEYENND